MKEERFKVCCAVYIIIRQENKILFLKRQNTGYMDGFYALPAGHLEDGETFFEAVIREAKEELNITIQEKDLNLVFTGNQVAPNKEYIDLFFEIKNFSGILKNNEPEKSSELDFFEFNNIKNKVIPYTAKVLTEIENKNNCFVFKTDY
ncbi:MAG: NUDIX domain-containing protein [Alphaproteobacteria bacterium]